MTVYEAKIKINDIVVCRRLAKTRELAKKYLESLVMYKVFEKSDALETAYDEVIDSVVCGEDQASYDLSISASIETVEVVE